MHLLVTGATGFIGSHFVDFSMRGLHRISAIRRTNSRPRISLYRDPTWIDGDLNSVKTETLAGVDVLVHLAATGVVEEVGWQQCFEINVLQSLALWNRAIDAGVRRIVVCGSCFEYGSTAERYDRIPTTAAPLPTGPYHASKAAATMAAVGLAVDRQIELAVLRPFHVYGDGEDERRLWPSLTRAAKNGLDFNMTAGEQVRDFVPVQTVAAEFFETATKTDLIRGKPIIRNIGTGNPETVANFARRTWESFGALGQLRVGALPYRQNEVMRFVPDLERRC